MKTNKKNVTKRLSAKEKNRQLMLEYLSDPSNQFITRAQMVTQVLGYKNASAIYNHFSPDELHEIERKPWTFAGGNIPLTLPKLIWHY